MSRLRRKRTPINKERYGIRRKQLIVVAYFLGALLLVGTVYLYRTNIQRLSQSLYQSFVMSTRKAGLTLENVFISGREKVSRQAILSSLGIPLHSPMVAFSSQETKERLEALPWVKKVRIEKHWPDSLFITLEEKKPLALWQNQGKTHLVDQNGDIIPEKNLKNFMYLPSINGPKAAKHLPKLLKILSRFPDLKKRVVSATWIGNRRWNIYLQGKITLMLPEDRVHEALERFSKYETTHNITKEVKNRVDLRIPQRIIIE